MKNISKVVVGFSIVASVALYMYFAKPSIEKKSSNFRSYQKEVAVVMPTILPPTKTAQLPNPNPKRQTAQTQKTISQTSTNIKGSHLNPLVNFLDHKTSKWSWSPNVFVLEKDKYQGPKNNIVGSHDGFEVIKDKNRPKDALSLVFNSIEKRLGVYTGKIIIVHQKTSDFEDKLKNIVGVNIEYVSGVYFLSSNSLADATLLISTIQNEIPSTQIDLDINYAFDRAN